MKRFCMFVVLACGLRGQSSAPAADSKCTIDVTAVNALTKEPVRHAEVQFQTAMRPPTGGSVQADNQMRAYVTRADDAGKATARLELGMYTVMLVRTGFLPLRYGAKRQNSASAPLACTAGRSQSIQAEMTPQSVLSGRVLDDEGEPMVNTQVMLLGMRYVNGKRQFAQMQGGQTNDRGEYRIASLSTGKYMVMTQPRQEFNNMGMRRIPLDASVSNQGYLATYYPSSPEQAQAVMVEVPVGGELANIDIRVRRGATYRVSGKVVDAAQAGGDRFGGFVQLVQRPQSGGIFMGGMSGGAGTRPNGQFELPSVAPGSYLLYVQRSVGNEQYQAMVPLDVNGDVDDITLTPQPGFTVSGAVSAQGIDKPDYKMIRVNLNSDFMRFGQPRSETKADGTFTLNPVWAGRYKLNAYYGAPKAYLASVMWNGKDVSGEEFEFSGASSGIELVFRADGSSVSGAASAGGNPVTTGTMLLLPVDAKRVAMGHLRTGPVANGRFSVQGVPPGEYYAFAMEDMDSYGIWEDPDWRKANESKMKRVTVTANGSATVDVEIVAGQAQ